ncbi:sensor histidine kinase [Streptomyces yaanensis]|uniref:histidine kinase n=1 Tax=Streptomyces yaanensis TaxID=1142239 RepID=A0ABV7S8I5_9ACTN|nr:histidine kinase [Streptomyces sp. CGMCC 4.7035]WNC03332.1 histidine kinase [Streptomyces sp. CGMCC 4.7035]
MPFVVPRGPELPPATWSAYAVTTLGVLPLVWRRRAPLSVLCAISFAGLGYRLALDGPGQPLPYAPLVAVYTVAALSPRRARIAMMVLAVPLIAVGVAVNTGEVRELLFTLIVFFGACTLGTLTRTRQAYAAAAERRAAEQAVVRERARIAREMHDVLSHSVALMVVQAEAGPVAVRTDPDRAEAAFDAISETGREAMVQLRRMLGVLREDAGDPRGPQPVVAELPALLERVSGSGLAVSYDTTGVVRPLPLDTEATVYRVVQEALTNVVKHAAADRVAVRLDYGRETLGITVTDDGRGPAASGPGGGHGLIGLRERAAAHGGTARTGPGPGGKGFEVVVTLGVGQ